MRKTNLTTASSGSSPAHREPQTAYQMKKAGARGTGLQFVRSRWEGEVLGPARRAAIRAALVVALAAVDRLSAHRREGNFGRHATGVARDAHHLTRAAFATVAITGGFSLVAAVLATLRFVREAALCVKRLFVPAEDELLAAVSAVEGFVVESVHETLIS